MESLNFCKAKSLIGIFGERNIFQFELFLKDLIGIEFKKGISVSFQATVMNCPWLWILWKLSKSFTKLVRYFFGLSDYAQEQNLQWKIEFKNFTQKKEMKTYVVIYRINSRGIFISQVGKFSEKYHIFYSISVENS